MNVILRCLNQGGIDILSYLSVEDALDEAIDRIEKGHSTPIAIESDGKTLTYHDIKEEQKKRKQWSLSASTDATQ